MNAEYKLILKRAMTDAVVKTKIAPSDTDKDVLGKIFNHFHQSLHGTSVQGWELASKVPRKMKSFNNYSSGVAEYISKLLATALVEVNKLNKNDEFRAIKESLYSMKVMALEAERVNKTSETVINRLSEIERDMNNG